MSNAPPVRPSIPPRRSPAEWAAISGLGFLGLTAAGGGVEMIAFPKGNRFVPGRWLDEVPHIDSWILPGIVLGGGFGVGSLVTAVSIWRGGRRAAGRSPRATRLAWAATLGLGVGLGGWIGLEVALIPERSALEAVYGVLAVGLAGVAGERLARSKPLQRA